MDETVIRNTIIRLYSIMNDLSYCIYDNFLNHYKLGRKEYGKLTLLEFNIYSLFVMNKFIQRYELDEIIYKELLSFTQNIGVGKFSYYLNSEKDIQYRYNNYEKYYLNDQLRDLNNLSILCEDFALESGGKSQLSIDRNADESNFNFSQKTDFTDEIIKHSLLLKKAAQEILAYRTQYETDEVIWSIRKDFEKGELFNGGTDLIAFISRNSPTPPESNPIFMQLMKIKTSNNIKHKEIVLVEEAIKNAIGKCYDVNTKNGEVEEFFVIYFNTKIALEGDNIFTKAELIQLWLEYNLSSLQKTLSDTMGLTEQIKSDIISNLNEKDLKLIDFVLNEFYSNYLNGEYGLSGIDETYTKLFRTRIYDNLKILFGDYVYFEINGIDNLSTYFSIMDFYEEKGKSNTITNSTDEDEDDLFEDEDLFVDDMELFQSDDIEDLYSYGKVFFHLMAMYFFKESENTHTFPNEIKKQSVFDSLRDFIRQIENFKHVTPEIIEFFNITKDSKILNVINENQGVGYMNLISELNFRLEHMDKELF